MGYRDTNKRQKMRSMQGVAARERIRLATAEDRINWLEPDDEEITITITRKLTGEKAEFKCTTGIQEDL